MTDMAGEADQLYHGPELDAAMVRAGAGPDEMAVCGSALMSRTKQLIDEQIALLNDEGPAGQCTLARAELVRIGGPFDDETVGAVAIRTTIGAAFTFGLQTGLELAINGKRGIEKEKS